MYCELKSRFRHSRFAFHRKRKRKKVHIFLDYRVHIVHQTSTGITQNPENVVNQSKKPTPIYIRILTLLYKYNLLVTKFIPYCNVVKERPAIRHRGAVRL